MVRITNGHRDRFIWPVHLSGWEQQGWSPVTAASPVLIAGSTQASDPSWVDVPKRDGSLAANTDPRLADPANADPHANFSLAVNPTGKRQSRAAETGSGAESPDAAEALRDAGMDDLAADPVDLRLEEPLL
jgi:hypothetical protein